MFLTPAQDYSKGGSGEENKTYHRNNRGLNSIFRIDSRDKKRELFFAHSNTDIGGSGSSIFFAKVYL